MLSWAGVKLLTILLKGAFFGCGGNRGQGSIYFLCKFPDKSPHLNT